jgi:hypothetical protein
MPLNSFQKEIIEKSIEHLIELPEDKPELTTAIKKLAICFTAPGELKEDDFLLLSKCIHESHKYFTNLERQNPDITKGDIQIAILDYLSHDIEKAAKKMDLLPVALGWDEVQIKAKLQAGVDFAASFNTELPAPAAEEHPNFWTPAGRRFSLHFIPAIEPPYVTLNLTIQAEEKEVKKSELIYIHDILRKIPRVTGQDFEDRIFLPRFAELVKEKATEIVGKLLLDALITAGFIAARYQYNSSLSAVNLLTYDYYYNAIKSKQIAFFDLLNLKPAELDILILPEMMQLIPGKLSVYEAARLTPAEILLLSNRYYNKEFFAGRITKSMLSKLSYPNAHGMVNPSITNLMQLDKFSFVQAKHMPAPVRDILKHEFYYENIKRDRFIYTSFENISLFQSKVLLDARIISLILNKHATLEDVLAINQRAFMLLTSFHLFAHYVDLGVIHIHDAQHFVYETDFTADVFEPLAVAEIASAKRFIADFILLAKQGMVSVADLTIFHATIKTGLSNSEQKTESSLPFSASFMRSANIVQCCQVNIRNRFVALLNFMPVVFNNNQPDTIKNLIESCKYFGFDFISVRDELLKSNIDSSLYREPLGISFFQIHQQLLDLTSINLYGQVLASRLIAIFEQRPCQIQGCEDTFSTVQAAIAAYAERYSMSKFALQAVAIQKFLSHLVDYINANVDFSHSETPAVYQKMILCIKQATARATELPEISRCLEWEKTFRSIQYLAALSRKESATDGYLEQKGRVSYKRVKTTVGLYRPSPFSHPSAALYQFCDRLRALAGLIEHSDLLNARTSKNHTL